MARMLIRRGSTPEIRIVVPEEACILDQDLYEALVTFKCSGMVPLTKKYTDGDLEADATTNTLSCRLSQEETLAMKASTGAVQLKILTIQDHALVSEIETFDIGPVLNEEVM